MEPEAPSSQHVSGTSWVTDNFECCICADDMTKKACVVTSCRHCFCEPCLQQWEAGQLAKGAEVRCPQCQQRVESYLPFEWPLFIANFREELVTKLQAIERDKATLAREKRAAEEQLQRDRHKQQQLQQTLDEMRTVTLKKNQETLRRNENDIAKLRAQIAAKEQAMAKAGAEVESQARAELEAARERMQELEVAGSALQSELDGKQREMAALQEATERGAAALAAKQMELDALVAQLNEDSNDGSVIGGAAWAFAALRGAAAGSGRALVAGYKVLRRLGSAPASGGLLRNASEFSLKHMIGTHCNGRMRLANDAMGGKWAIKWRSDVRGASREGLLLAALRHPHVLTLQGVLRHDNTGLGLVFPFYGHDLQYALAPDRAPGSINLPVGAGMRILRGLFAALAYVHAQEVVHRSVSTAAVLLEDSVSASPILTGWTEACSLASPVPSSPLVARSSTRYRAPEYLLGTTASSALDWKAFDVWAAGCVAWELLLDDSCTPVVTATSRNLDQQLASLFMWRELREQATEWLQVQPAPGDFPVLERAIAASKGSKSLLETLQTPSKMIAPEAAQMVLRMLSWDPSRRPSFSNLLAGKFFADAADLPRGRDVEPGSLSDAALDQWIHAYAEDE